MLLAARLGLGLFTLWSSLYAYPLVPANRVPVVTLAFLAGWMLTGFVRALIVEWRCSRAC